MATQLVLTFAEIEFLLAARPADAIEARSRLRLDPAADSPEVRSAGMTSLLVRGLATQTGDGVTPGQDLVGVIAALSLFDSHIETLAWKGNQTTVLHLFGSADIRLALQPGPYRQYLVQAVDPALPVTQPLLELLDSVVGDPASGILVRCTTTPEPVGVAVGVDASGTWYVSESEENPTSGVPASRDVAVDRLGALFGPSSVGADR